MPQSILGVDIGSYSVKIIHVERGLSEFKIVNFFELPLVAAELLNREQAGSAALTKFFQDHPLKYDYAVMSLPGNLVAVRYLELPFTKKQKIDSVIGLELEEYVPFESDQLTMDYHVIERLGGLSRVLVAYLKVETFKKNLETLQAGGLDPRYVGVDSIDLSHLSQTNCLPTQGTYVLLDVGHGKTNLVFMRGNRLRAVRTLNVGGLHFTQSLQEALQIPYAEAEEHKHSQGQISDATDAGSVALKQVATRLFHEVKQTLFAYYERGEAPIDALYLCGGGSRLAGIDQFFSNCLRVNVSPLDVLDDHYTHLSDRESVRPIVPTAFGAALRAIFPGKVVALNFRQGDFAYKRDIEQLEGSFKKIAVLAAVVAFLALTHFISSYWILSGRVEKLNKNVDKMVRNSLGDLATPKGSSKILTASKALTELTNKTKTLKDKLAKMENEQSMSALEVLKKISDATPNREEVTIDVGELNIASNRVSFKGKTTSYDAVAKIQANLQKQSGFQNVTTGDQKKGINDEINFTISFDLVAN